MPASAGRAHTISSNRDKGEDENDNGERFVPAKRVCPKARES